MTDAAEGRLRLAAYALCERDGAVLLCRLSSSERAAGRWMLPGGGLDFGEAPDEGVLRELDEETGLQGEVRELVGVVSHLWPPGITPDGRSLHAVGILYRVDIAGGELRDEPEGGSTDRAAWIPVAELADLPLTVTGAALLARAGLMNRRAASEG